MVFVDEIDTTLRLDFTDDFFAAIRFLYQHRAADPALERLSFVLIGVATPGDLIKDAARTPFNIGHRIELTDFTLDEACALTKHLRCLNRSGGDVIGWTLRWTGGHPYLTLRARPHRWPSRPPASVDGRGCRRACCARCSSDERGETDSNLQFVRDMLTKKAFNREAVLRTYLGVRRGETGPGQGARSGHLVAEAVGHRRSGATDCCRCATTMYEQVFDERWAREHLRA